MLATSRLFCSLVLSCVIRILTLLARALHRCATSVLSWSLFHSLPSVIGPCFSYRNLCRLYHDSCDSSMSSCLLSHTSFPRFSVPVNSSTILFHYH